MALDTHSILDPIRAHAAALGVFDTVGGHEPKRAPGTGLTFALWVDRINPIPSSGLTSTSIRFTVLGRIYGPMLAEPQDEIDPGLVEATDLFLNSLHGDFQLDDLVTAVDLLGQSGSAMAGQAGYIKLGDGLYRVMDIDIPVIIADAWEQVP